MLVFRTIDDFLESWAEEAQATHRVFQALTDTSLAQPVYDEGRSLGRIAWHIVQTLPEMAGHTGLDVPGPAEDEPIPTSAEQIAARFKESADGLAREVKEKWTDEDLEVEDDLYGERWTRSLTLTGLINHQIHHRGQMTVLMRQAGLKVPGVYGPSKEEWSDFGMPPQE